MYAEFVYAGDVALRGVLNHIMSLNCEIDEAAHEVYVEHGLDQVVRIDNERYSYFVPRSMNMRFDDPACNQFCLYRENAHQLSCLPRTHGYFPRGRIYFVTEYLRPAIGPQWTPQELLCLIATVADALGRCHAVGLYHGDLEARHLCLSDTGDLRITGWCNKRYNDKLRGDSHAQLVKEDMASLGRILRRAWQFDDTGVEFPLALCRTHEPNALLHLLSDFYDQLEHARHGTDALASDTASGACTDSSASSTTTDCRDCHAASGPRQHTNHDASRGGDDDFRGE